MCFNFKKMAISIQNTISDNILKSFVNEFNDINEDFVLNKLDDNLQKGLIDNDLYDNAIDQLGWYLEKAGRDIKKLSKRIIVDKNGIRRTVYVRTEHGDEHVLRKIKEHHKAGDLHKINEILSDKKLSQGVKEKLKAENLHHIVNHIQEQGLEHENNKLYETTQITKQDKYDKELTEKIEKKEQEQEIKRLKKNAYPAGTKIKGKNENAVITGFEVKDGKVFYSVKTDSGKEFKNIEQKLIQVLPETNDKKITELINNATPENRNITEILINGTCEPEKTKTVEEVVIAEKNKSDNKEVSKFNWNFNPKPDTFITPSEKVITTNDYTEIPLIEFYDVKQKGILEREQPEFIKKIGIINNESFARNGYTFSVVKLEEGNVMVKIPRYDYDTERYEKTNVKSFKNDYLKMSIDYYVALQSYYQKVSKENYEIKQNKEIEGKKEYYRNKGYTEKEIAEIKFTKKRIKILGSNRATYDDINFYELITGEKGRTQFWEDRKKIMADRDQKIIDLELQAEDMENTHSKGEKTSFGDSKLNNSLFEKYGVKVKRQNGNEINKSEIEQLDNAIGQVYSVFGDRSEIAKKWGLKISHSGEVLMHARKALGIFFPYYNAIGVSFGKSYAGKITLAHEFGHFIDYWLGKKKGCNYATDNYNSLEGEIAKTFQKNMNETQSSKYQNRTCECFARSLEQYFTYKTNKADYEIHCKESNHVNKENFEKKVVPLIDRFFKENNELLKSLHFDIIKMSKNNISKAFK